YLFFFFQTADGIRDATVTGVQTCALPIFNCVSNLKQLTTAAVLYQNDSGSSPGSVAYGAVASLWMETLIIHYARVSAIRLCPDAPDRNPKPSGTTQGDAATSWFWSGPTTYTGSYGMNSWLYT